MSIVNLILYEIVYLNPIITGLLFIVEAVFATVYFGMLFEIVHNITIKKCFDWDEGLSLLIPIIVFILSLFFPIIIPFILILYIINVYKCINIKHCILYDKPLYGDSFLFKETWIEKIIKTMEEIEEEELLTRDVLKAYCKKYNIFELNEYDDKKYKYLMLNNMLNISCYYDFDFLSKKNENLKNKILEGVHKYTDMQVYKSGI